MNSLEHLYYMMHLDGGSSPNVSQCMRKLGEEQLVGGTTMEPNKLRSRSLQVCQCNWRATRGVSSAYRLLCWVLEWILSKLRNFGHFTAGQAKFLQLKIKMQSKLCIKRGIVVQILDRESAHKMCGMQCLVLRQFAAMDLISSRNLKLQLMHFRQTDRDFLVTATYLPMAALF